MNFGGLRVNANLDSQANSIDRPDKRLTAAEVSLRRSTVSATSIPRLSSVDGGGAVRCFRTSA
ncbi:hypothetical protein GOD68_26215, partial [Sinorhizobium medicae]|nr:hypothetical protein [Sinorhizobium medicae]MDX0672519.1 hypothetical protein [Sinorhizobium medicae]MDX0709945.1 hypothetical protein [Sinorhizobium medicae]